METRLDRIEKGIEVLLFLQILWQGWQVAEITCPTKNTLTMPLRSTLPEVYRMGSVA